MRRCLSEVSYERNPFNCQNGLKRDTAAMVFLIGDEACAEACARKDQIKKLDSGHGFHGDEDETCAEGCHRIGQIRSKSLIRDLAILCIVSSGDETAEVCTRMCHITFITIV